MKNLIINKAAIFSFIVFACVAIGRATIQGDTDSEQGMVASNTTPSFQAYAVMGVSGDFGTPWQIVLDDSDNVAFTITDTTDIYTWTPTTPATYKGTILNGQSAPFFDADGTYEGDSGWELAGIILRPNGDSFGYMQFWDLENYDDEPREKCGAVSYQWINGNMTFAGLPDPFANNFSYGGTISESNYVMDVSNTCYCGLSGSTPFGTGTNMKWFAGGYATVSGTTFAYSTSDSPAGTGTLIINAINFQPMHINDYGVCIGEETGGDGVSFATSVVQFVKTGFIALNNQGSIIGNDFTKTPIEQPTLWQHKTSAISATTDWDEIPIVSLLPKQCAGDIVGITPLAISGTDTNGNYAVIFSATYVPQGGDEAIPGTFILTKPVTSNSCTLHEMQIPLDATTITKINSSGILPTVCTVPVLTGTVITQSTSPRGALLVPVTLTNLADSYIPHKNMDTPISFMQSGTDTNIDCVAWIAAHDPNNADAPRMPKLQVTAGAIPGLIYCWKLQVTFHDRNNNPHRDFDTSDPNDTNTTAYLFTNPISSPGSSTAYKPDQIDIPDLVTPRDGDADVNGWYQIKDGSPWNIYATADWTAAVTTGFFGGDATLSLMVMDSGSNVIMPQTDFKFRIGGENPDPVKAKTFIDANDVGYWYAYAIAKAETQGEGGQPFYNHFLANGGGGVTKTDADPGKEGRPNWNNDSYYSKKRAKLITALGSGGYGLFQLTYREDTYDDDGSLQTGDSQYIMNRDWIWNWQTNTVRAMADLNGHVSYVNSMYNYLKTTGSPSIQYERCPSAGDADAFVFSSLEGILICVNNGNDGFQKFLKTGQKTPWQLNITTGVWTFTGTYGKKVAGCIE